MIRNLTGIRGVAALWVLMHHYEEYYVGLFPYLKFLDFIFANGFFGVDLFFCLSGFILGYVYYDNLTNSTLNLRNNRIKSYLVKRFARIYPVYIRTTLIAGIFYLIAILTNHNFNHESASNFSFKIALINCIGIQTWLGVPSLNGPAWSVSAEYLAYLYFPLLLFILRFRANSKYVVFIAAFAFYEYSLLNSSFLRPEISRVLSEFTMGLCSFVICRNITLKKRNVILLRLLLTTGILLIIYIVKTQLMLQAIIPLLLLLVICANYFSNVPNRGLGRKYLVKLGLWSYSLYLSHRLLQNVMSGLNLPMYQSNILFRLLQLILLIILPIVLAWVITLIIENPCRKLILKSRLN